MNTTKLFLSGLVALTCLPFTSLSSAAESRTTVREQVAIKSDNHTSTYHPERVFGELFEQVQVTKILGDYKTFVDAIPLRQPSLILADYQHQKSKADFDLKYFVEQNFSLPKPAKVKDVRLDNDMISHLKRHWPMLVKHPKKTDNNSSLVELPYPYVVPGGRFREMFYWDSYFSIIGLLKSDQDELTKGIINNFAYLIDEFGHVPNGNRSYFLSRSQPPFFAATLTAYANKFGTESIVEYLPQLEKEYLFWMDGHSAIPSSATTGKHLVVLENGDYFNRYYGAQPTARPEAFGKETKWAKAVADDKRPEFHRALRAACESGWDFSSRWFADGNSKSTTHTMDIIPVDLNSLLYQLELLIAKLHKYQGKESNSAFYHQRAIKRQQLINMYHFDAAKGIYQDYDFVLKQHTNRESLAMMYPLFVGAATQQQAESVSSYIDKHFLKAGGLVTSLTQTGEQWDYPNGWAPLQYLSVIGLQNYQQNTLANNVMTRWLALNEKVYKADGKMMEKYNVVDINIAAGGGEYPNQDGFGWTNGVAIAFDELLRLQPTE